MRSALATSSSLVLAALLLCATSAAWAESRTLDDYRILNRIPPGHYDDELVIRVVFDYDDPFEFLMRTDVLIADPRILVPYQMDGETLMIPKQLRAVREGLLAAKAYSDARGYETEINTASRMTVWLDYLPDDEPLGDSNDVPRGDEAELEDEDFEEDPDAMFRGSTAITDTLFLWFNATATPRELLRAAIHEWYHVLQDQVIKTIPAFKNYLNLMNESSADWFTDLPIPFGPEARRIAGASTADGLNLYYQDFGTWWFPELDTGLFREMKTINAFNGYRGVFLFKFFTEKIARDDPDGQLKAVRDFFDAYRRKVSAGDNRSGVRLFAEVIGESLGGRRSSDQFRSFWGDFLAANVEQVAGRLGSYRDDAFSEYCCPNFRTKEETGPIFVVAKDHYSEMRPSLEAQVAVGEDEIRKRLHRKLEPKKFELEPFAAHLFAITLPGSDPGTPSWLATGDENASGDVEGVTKVFVQVTSKQGDPDDWTSALLTQNRGSRDARGRGIEFKRVSPFSMEPRRAIGTLSSAMARIKWFGKGARLVDTERVWVAVANLNPENKSHELLFSWVVTPFFEPSYGDDADEDPRGSRTVRFVESDPEREENQFRPGDRITLEIDLSDAVHEGPGENIPPNQRSLEIEVVDGDEVKLDVTDEKLSLADAEAHRYRYAFTLPEGSAYFGDAEVRFTVRSLLKLGEGDRNDDAFAFEVIRIPPEVVQLRFSRGEEIFYDSEGEAFRPVSSGEVEISIRFDRDMNRTENADVKHEVARHWRPIDGDWAGDREWRARYEIPAGEAFADWKGFSRVSIQATSADGEQIDADPESEGSQPDESHRILIGAVPPVATHVTVSQGSDVLYDARWVGGPDLGSEINLTQTSLGSPRRTLEREIEDLPSEGVATIEIEFSQPLDAPPGVHVGPAGADLADAGDGLRWSGQFDLAAAHEGQGGVVHVRIQIHDRFGNRLDADPRTVTRIGTERDKPWLGWEHEVGEPAEGHGGPDLWHELAEPPSMSLAIVLDTSGSMEGDKIANAKRAILQLLAQLPSSVELALVAFSGCGPPNHIVPFTRDADVIRTVVDSVEANGGTAYALGLRAAHELLAASAHPESRILKYAPFSDGEETCDGDPIAAIDALEALIAARTRRDPDEPEEETPAPVEDDEPEIACNPGEWEVYSVRVRDGGLHLDRIRMVETRRQERRTPDGHCEVNLSEETYGVTYGEIDQNAATMRWRINSRSSTRRSRTVSSAGGEAPVTKLRQKAAEARAAGTNLATTRSRIEAAVRRSLDRNRRPPDPG